MYTTQYQPATMTMAVPAAAPQYVTMESVAAPTYQTITTGATTYAAPTYGTTIAAPTYATYAAPTYETYGAPTVVETVAPTVTAAPVTYAAPVTQTMTYSGSVAAPLTIASGSVAAPVAAPQAITTLAPSYSAPQVLQTARSTVDLGPPVALTAGIPTPDQITAQKAAYAAALEKQLKDGIETITKETEIEKNMIKFNADKTIALAQMQIEEQRNEQLAYLDEQATIRQCELRKAYVERKLQLDNQANGLNLDYQYKFVQTELAQKQYEFQQTYMKAENKLEAQFEAVAREANKGTSYTIPAAAVSAR